MDEIVSRSGKSRLTAIPSDYVLVEDDLTKIGMGKDRNVIYLPVGKENELQISDDYPSRLIRRLSGPEVLACLRSANLPD